MATPSIRTMSAADFAWAASLMAARRAEYEAYSPVFWRPANGVTDSHAAFMASVAERSGSLALRSEHGFLLVSVVDGRGYVDDFAVEDATQWATEGRALVLAAWDGVREAGQQALRVVTAGRDEPKRSMLESLGLLVAARWWVKELNPTGPATEFGPVQAETREVLVVPAPPVYDPGGPVCLLGDPPPVEVEALAEAAAGLGCVLAVIQKDGHPGTIPAREPHLERLGFHNPSEFYQGSPEGLRA